MTGLSNRRLPWVASAAILASVLTIAIVGVTTPFAHTNKGHHNPVPHGKLVSWDITMTIDTVGAGAPPIFQVGGTDKLRVVYDPRDVDKKTGDVRIKGLQHFIGGSWGSADAQPASDQSVFNVNTKRLDFQRAVTHGTPIVLVFTPAGYAGVLNQSDLSKLISGPYAADPTGPKPCNAKTWLKDKTTC